jgi:radical SAM superfamily enzyme YgiQ (UPF0313 family)
VETCDLSTRFGLELLWIVDDNFRVDLERGLDIAEGLARANASFRWSIQATTNLTARLSVDELRLLRRAGLQQICQGVDSASPRILNLMNKTFQDFESIYLSAERCIEAGIRPSFNIIFAYPGEDNQDRRQTIAFIMDVCRRFPGAEFWTNIFTPYPGSPIMQHAEENGIEVPDSFEGWADYFPRYTVLPWLKGKAHDRVQVMRDYLRMAFDRVPISKVDSSSALRILQRGLAYPARWRLDHDVYGLPIEVWINRKVKRFVSVARPKVDAKQLEPAPAGDSR